MGLLGALQAGKSALFAYQGALQTTSQNIANAGNEDYVRQSPVLTAVPGAPIQGGFLPGNGVKFSSLQRHIDEALESRLRVALGDQKSALARHETLSRIESVVNELTDTDLSTLTNEFFNSFSTVQNTPQDIAARGVVLANGERVVQEVRRQRNDLLATVDEVNSQIVQVVVRANQIVDDVAKLNAQIVAAESSNSGQASGLRDQRDSLLRELSGNIEISTIEQSSGAVNVYIGNEPVVQYGVSRGLTTTLDIGTDIDRVTVRFADNNGPIDVRGGKIEGMITSREQDIVGHLQQLDSFASALVTEVNKLHTDGQGTVGFTNVLSTQRVLDSSLPLSTPDNGLDFLPGNGSFYIAVTNETNGEVRAVQVEVDLDGIDPTNDTSLDDLVGNINTALNAAYGGSPPVTATVTSDNRLDITASPTFSFTFGNDGAIAREDTSDVLAALGVNTFFNGSTANDIALNPTLAADPKLLAVAQTNEIGDGGNAGRIAALAQAPATSLNGVSVLDFYNGVVSDLAVKTSSASNAIEASDVVASSLQAKRDSVSGVSLDEEAINLLTFQRAFQGAARIISVVDEMLRELLALAR